MSNARILGRWSQVAVAMIGLGLLGSPLAAGEIVANPVDSTRKILRDDPMPDWVRFGALPAKPWEEVAPYEPLEAVRMKTARVDLARNEFENVQIVVRALGNDAPAVRLELGELRNDENEAVFPAEDVTLWKVGYVEMFSLWKPDYQLGWWPDPLMPLEPGAPFSVGADRNQAVLVQFHARNDTTPGTYRGAVTVRSGDDEALRLPIEVRVWPFAIPTEQHFTVSIPIWGGHQEKMYPGKQTPESRRAFLDTLYDYRIAPFPLADDEIEHAIERGVREFNLVCFPKDYVAPENVEKAGAAAVLWREKGWDKRARAYVLLGDEPHLDQLGIIKEQGTRMKEAAPDVLRMNTVSTYDKMEARTDLFYERDISSSYREFYGKTFDTLHDAVDVFILGAGYAYPVDETTRFLQGKGAKLWWYYVAGPVYIPCPGVVARGTLWKHWNYGVPGLLHWGMTYWGDINIGGKDGRTWPKVPWDTRECRGGDGYLMYPAPDGKTYWPSMRLECIRDGAEDYEYLYLLNELTERLAQATNPTEGAKEQIAGNRLLLDVETRVAFPSADDAYAGDGLLALRTRVAEAIVASQELLAR